MNGKAINAQLGHIASKWPSFFGPLQEVEAVMGVAWKLLWKLKIPSKEAFFLWTAARGHLPTIDLLQHRGMIRPNVPSLPAGGGKH